jgi:phosphoribosylformylglycinamidine (FGAM) synthase PurS component
MSLEIKIEELTKAVIGLTELIGKIEAGKTVELDLMAESRAQIVRDLEKQDKVITAAVEKQIAAEAATVMPAAPVFEAPAPVVADAKAPFTDGKSLITYVMDTYKQLGAEKGAGIQNVLVTLGYQNINDVKPEHYDALYAGIEALK